MSAIVILKQMGLTPRLDGKGGFLLRGLQGLDTDTRRKMTEFARHNKPRIVAELERQETAAGRTTPSPAGQAKDVPVHGGFRGEAFFPSDFSDPLFRLAAAEGKLL
jgi:hypothetical protein